MICLIALFVFAVLGIFSAKYRELSKEAFNCVFRRITLRKCETGFDKKMKAGIVTKFMNRSPAAARAITRHFEIISWFFTITLLVSTYYTGLGLYNYAVYGNCSGANSNEFCIFNPLGSDNNVSCSEYCATEGCKCGGPEENCTASNNYAACNGNCTCNKTVCGGG